MEKRRKLEREGENRFYDDYEPDAPLHPPLDIPAPAPPQVPQVVPPQPPVPLPVPLPPPIGPQIRHDPALYNDKNKALKFWLHRTMSQV